MHRMFPCLPPTRIAYPSTQCDETTSSKHIFKRSAYNCHASRLSMSLSLHFSLTSGVTTIPASRPEPLKWYTHIQHKFCNLGKHRTSIEFHSWQIESNKKWKKSKKLFKSYRVNKNLRPAAAALAVPVQKLKLPPVYRGDLINACTDTVWWIYHLGCRIV